MIASVLFALTLFVSAGLLFIVQPLCARLLLPVLGGSPAVWNSCMLFFQAGLLAGYAYAHLLPRWLSPRWQAFLHLPFLILAWWQLGFPEASRQPPERPVLWLLSVLTLAVGMSFFLLSSSAPLLQRWFHRLFPAKDPYVLYAASNLGSFTGLLAYPLLIEPNLTLGQQCAFWGGGFAALIVLTGLCGGMFLLRGKSAEAGAQMSEVSDGKSEVKQTKSAAGGNNRKESRKVVLERNSIVVAAQRQLASSWLRWLMLSFVTSSLLLSVTTHLTTDITPIPLLWVIPLALYLLTFVIVFATTTGQLQKVLIRWMPMVALILVLLYLLEATDPHWLVLGLHLLGFFWIALVCHGELARTRPPAQNLTGFYLVLAIGSVLGAAFNVLLAPLIFSSLLEYPLMLVAACLLRPSLADVSSGTSGLRRDARRADFLMPLALGVFTASVVVIFQFFELEAGPVSVAIMFAGPLLVSYFWGGRPLKHGLSVGAILLASALYYGVQGPATVRLRSFFGVHRVTSIDNMRSLVHGHTVHGKESLNPIRRDEPLTYYSRRGPCGQFFEAYQGDARLNRVGLVGLGAGSLASYATRGQHWTFFEIDPGVIWIARDSGLFHFVPDRREEIDVIEGDGRLSIAQQEDKFGVIVLDAFGSDAIPMHLLTREAVQVYLGHLQPNGVLLVHISNNYVDLEPVLAKLAQDADLTCRVNEDLSLDPAAVKEGVSPSVWVVLARRAEDLAPLKSARWQPATAQPGVSLWTDDFSNILEVLRW